MQSYITEQQVTDVIKVKYVYHTEKSVGTLGKVETFMIVICVAGKSLITYRGEDVAISGGPLTLMEWEVVAKISLDRQMNWFKIHIDEIKKLS